METQLPDGNTGKLPKIPLRLNGKPFNLRSQPPGIGNGTRELLQKAGLSESEILELFDEYVVSD